MRTKRRPVLGAISGFFLGVFIALLLAIYAVRPLDAISAFGLPALGLVLGLLIGTIAPFRQEPPAGFVAGGPPTGPWPPPPGAPPGGPPPPGPPYAPPPGPPGR